MTNIANTEQLLRIIQSIPSKKEFVRAIIDYVRENGDIMHDSVLVA